MALDLKLQLDVVRGGIVVTWTLAAAVAGYAALTWDRPHRAVILAFAALAAAEAASRLRRTPAGGQARIDRVMAARNVVLVAATAVLCLLDGGVSSPLASIFFVSVAYAAVGLPPQLTALVAAANLLALLVVAIAGPTEHNWQGFLLLRGAGLVATGAVCSTIARERLQRLSALSEAKEEMLRRLARVVEYRDRDTGDHIGRMSGIAALLGRRLGMSADEADTLALASTMHDIGKVAIPDAILLKPGALTDEERVAMQRHARIGHDMLTGSSSELLQLAATIALTHHERYDGGGYPQGLHSTDIPLAGRIVAVADVFDALTSDRVYKRGIPNDEAVAMVTRDAGHHFDPSVVDAFLAEREAIVALQPLPPSASDAPEARLGERMVPSATAW